MQLKTSISPSGVNIKSFNHKEMKRFILLANLLLISWLATAQRIPYGNNPKAGTYLKTKDGTKIYYEVYGAGKPIALLHGGVYGYIDEFEPFISKLAEKYKVICIATRGHGKSEIGNAPFTYQQRAEDAYQVIRSITPDSVTVLGFSDGAYSGYKLAALHPELVQKLIAIGAADRPKEGQQKKANYTPESLLKGSESFFKSRLALMPEPNRWGESLAKLNKLYNEDYVSQETFEKIKCPVLVMSGDRDGYHPVEAVVTASRMIPNAQLSVIAGCDHVVFFCNFPAVWETTQKFLNQVNPR
jgi:pimeloyl-ACP methyl ester carboxylesterase